MIPLPAGITSTFLNASLVHSMKWKRSSLRRSSIALHRQRVVDDQLHRHHRVHLRRVAAFLGDRVAQAGQVDQRGLAQDVVAHHPRREPGEVAVAPALDELRQRLGEDRRVAAAHQVLGQHPRGVGQRVVGARPDRLDRLARVEVVQRRARQPLAVARVHVRSSIGTKVRSSGPT
jgi:hypothetical protein